MELREPPSIYQFHGFREYVTKRVEHLKQSQAGFTLSVLADKAGLTLAHLSMILKGKRRLKKKNFVPLSKHLGLSAVERSYLKLLWTIEDSSSSERKQLALKKARRFHKYQELNPNEIEVCEYLGHWHISAIREMAALDDFKPDPNWIRSRLRRGVSLQEIRTALEFLERHGFIDLSKKGAERISKKPIRCHGEVFKVALTRFYDEMLDLQKEAIHKTASDEKWLTAYACAVGESDLAKVRAIIDEAREKVAQVERDRKASETVVYVNLGFFPLTRRVSLKKKAKESS